jgi:hypothetical protein
VRRLAAGAGGGCDRPFVAGPPARPGRPAVDHESGVAHALQMGAHAVGVQVQSIGQVGG